MAALRADPVPCARNLRCIVVRVFRRAPSAASARLMAIRWPITSTASMRLLVGIRPASDLVEVVPDARHLPGALALDLGVRHGPSVRPADRSAHQIRQRQACRARLGVPLGTLRLAGANLHPNGASGLMARRCLTGGLRGQSPPPASAGDSRSVAPRSMLAEPRLTWRLDKPCGDLSLGRRWPAPTRWRSTPANAPGNPFNGPREASVGGGMAASDAGPSMYPRSRSGD